MARIEPAQPRFQTIEDPQGLRIVIPMKRQWLLTLFLSGWLIAWAAGEWSALNEVMRPKEGFFNIFLLGWLIGWTAGGVWAFYMWMRSLAGREIIFVDGGSLVVRKEAFGIGRSREFDFSQVRDLRVSPIPDWGRWGWSFGQGVITFDYGAKTYKIGENIEEAEAKLIIESIKRRFPAFDSA